MKSEGKRGWFMGLREEGISVSKVQREAASVDVKAAASYTDLAQVINESGYSKQQMFSIDKTAFCWKKMPSRTFTAREVEVRFLGFKGQTDSLVSG